MPFILDDRVYLYFEHEKNATIENERRVEIPWALPHLRGFTGSILEVGNVLTQYTGTGNRTVVDLKEKGKGILNADILEYKPEKPYDMIISISTFEHIGIDDMTADRIRAIDAVKRCATTLLAPGGQLVFTVPVGYNPILDEWLFTRWPGTNHYMLRTTRTNRWVQVDPELARRAKYGSPFSCANAVVFSRYTREKEDCRTTKEQGEAARESSLDAAGRISDCS